MPRKPTASPDHPDRAAIMARLRRLAPKQIFERFLQLQAETANGLFEQACCAAALQAHPVYFSRIKMAATYLRIARGEIDLDAYLTLIASPACEPVTVMPKDEQRKVAKKRMVTVVDPVTRETRKADIATLDRKTALQVCGPNGVRSEAEQNEYLDAIPPPRPQEKPSGHQHSLWLPTEKNLELLDYTRTHRISVSALLLRGLELQGVFKPQPSRAHKKAAHSRVASQ